MEAGLLFRHGVAPLACLLKHALVQDAARRRNDAQFLTIRGQSRPLFFMIPERVENRQSHEIPLIGGDDDAIVGAGNGSYDHVERIARSSRRPAFGHQPRPEQRCLLVEWQNAPGE